MTEEKGELKKYVFGTGRTNVCVCILGGLGGSAAVSVPLHQNVTYVSHKCVWKLFGTLPLPHEPPQP